MKNFFWIKYYSKPIEYVIIGIPNHFILYITLYMSSTDVFFNIMNSDHICTTCTLIYLCRVAEKYLNTHPQKGTGPGAFL